MNATTVDTMCPYCGRRTEPRWGLVRIHTNHLNEPVDSDCPGSGQIPRSIHDHRPLWSGRPNPHLEDR